MYNWGVVILTYCKEVIMIKFITFLICKGYLSCQEQGTDKIIKLIIKNNPLLIKDFFNKRRDL